MVISVVLARGSRGKGKYKLCTGCTYWVLMRLSQQKTSLPATVPYDLAYRILNRIPPEYRQSFTPEQVAALQTALVENRQKPLFRLTLGSFCLSLVEKRSPGSHRKQRSQSMLAPILCMMVSIVGVGCVAGLLKFRYEHQSANSVVSPQAQEQSFYPTVLPFRKDQASCEKNGAVWIDQECVDYAHDPTF